MNELNDIRSVRKVKRMSDDKTDRILNAAEDLFLQRGLRATTMEGIAKAAGVAKPTLYDRFPDKETVFKAGVARVMARMREGVERELGGAGPARERIARALSVKFAIMTEILSRYPNAAQIFEEHRSLVGPEFAELNGWVIAQTAAALAADGHAEPLARAELLHACIDGLKTRWPAAQDLAEKVRFVTDLLLD
jgi:AcrR family transcriptional regulator